MGQAFDELVASLPQRGVEWHRETILRNSRENARHVGKTIRDIEANPRPCLIISGGPSLYREGIFKRLCAEYRRPLTFVVADSAYIQCLKAGISPDFVITLDPHPTRMVRWFGDPDLEKNMNGDDYFSRQDLDLEFRFSHGFENERNISFVNLHRTPLVISSTAPGNVVERTAKHERYWFAPLVDDPHAPDSITRDIVDATGLPAMNTGGTVGTAAWVFAHSILKSQNIAVVGVDLGYYPTTPLKETQSWHMLNGDRSMYPVFANPDGMLFMTDPTYWWYRHNFLDLLENNNATVTNCGGAGLFFGERVKWQRLEEWLASC